MENNKRENTETAHSTIRKHLTDSFDEGRLSHYLGNDDYKDGNFEPSDELLVNPYLEGKFADGNDEIEEAETASPEEKKEDSNQESPGAP